MNTGLSRQKAKAIIQEIGYTLFATEVFPKTHKRTPNIEKMLNIGPKQYPSDLIELLENIYNSFTFPDYTCDFYVYKAINNDTVLYYIYIQQIKIVLSRHQNASSPVLRRYSKWPKNSNSISYV